jgi:hypothetical protein
MVAIPKPGADFTPAPAGTWPAVCTRIVDLGTQDRTYKGVVSKSHQVLISWELHDDECKGDDGKPMLVQRSFTWSMSPKANLRKTLESWRGKPFAESDFGTFDIRALLGAGCLIGVTHETKEGNTYANISSVLKLPKGVKSPKPSNGQTCIWLHEEIFDADAFEKLSDKLKEKIKASPEYQEMVNGGAGDQSNGDIGDDEDDETPF